MLAALVVEAAARALHRARGDGWSPAAARARLSEVHQQLHRRDWAASRDERPAADDPAALALHPYVGYESRGTQAAFGELAAATRATRPAEVFELGIVGGSVSCLVAHEAGRHLSEALRADPRFGERRVRIHVLGQGGLKQPQQTMAVVWAFANGWRLDAVVNVDGFNEVAIGLQNATFGAHPLYPSFPHWSHLMPSHVEDVASEERRAELHLARGAASRACERARDGPWLASAALGPLLLGRVEGSLVAFRDAQSRYTAERARGDARNVSLFGPAHAAQSDALVETAVQGWYEASLSLAGACRERGVCYLHVLQPTLHDEGSKPLTPAEVEAGRAIDAWVIGCKLGYPRLRERGGALAEHGVDFLDASRLFQADDRSLYYDACHFRLAGLELLAEAIAERLLARMP